MEPWILAVFFGRAADLPSGLMCLTALFLLRNACCIMLEDLKQQPRFEEDVGQRVFEKYTGCWCWSVGGLDEDMWDWMVVFGTAASITLFRLLHFSGCFGFALDITSMGNMCSGVLSWMTVWFAIGRILVWPQNKCNYSTARGLKQELLWTCFLPWNDFIVGRNPFGHAEARTMWPSRFTFVPLTPLRSRTSLLLVETESKLSVI